MHIYTADEITAGANLAEACHEKLGGSGDDEIDRPGLIYRSMISACCGASEYVGGVTAKEFGGLLEVLLDELAENAVLEFTVEEAFDIMNKGIETL